METISLAIEFVSSQGSGSSDISAQTGDILSWILFLFISLFCVFGIVGYCCWKKKVL